MNLHRGQGSFLWMEGDDTPYLDLMMAYSSTNFGHANPTIIKAINAAAKLVDNTAPLDYPIRRELSQRLINQIPYTVTNHQVHYTEGGAKSVESAIELTKVISGKQGVIAFKGAFHGYATSVIGVSDLSFIMASRAQFKHEEIVNVEFPESEEAVDRVLNQLSELLNNGEIGTVMLETSQGMAGFRLAPKRFFTEIQSLVKETNTLLVIDDILMGMGRTGWLYSFNDLGLRPDIILLGKSLGGGYYPLAAVIADNDLFEKAGVACTGLDSTFSNSPFGIYIANEVQKMIENENIYKHVRRMAIPFRSMLAALMKKYKKDIIAISANGLAGSLRLKDAAHAQQILDISFNNHLIVQYAGLDHDYIRFTPSLLITRAELEQAHRLLDKVFSEVFVT